MPATDNRLRIGVLGTGKVARHHAAVAGALGHRVVAGATRRADSPNWPAFKDAAPDARHVGDPDELLANDEIDAVIAALPWHEMTHWLDRLLACPKPVLLEKPIALSAARIAEVLGRSDTRSDNKMIGFNRRFYAPARRIADRLARGGLKTVHVTISEDIERQVKGHGPDILPHLMAFSSSHSLDLMLHLLGPLTPVRVYRHDERGYPGPVVSYNGLFESPSGVPVWLSLNADDPSPAGMRLLFDDHTTFHLAPLERLCIYDRYEIQEQAAGSQIRRYVPHAAEEVIEPADYKPGFLAQMTAFASGAYGPAAKIEDSLALHQFIEALPDLAE